MCVQFSSYLTTFDGLRNGVVVNMLWCKVFATKMLLYARYVGGERRYKKHILDDEFEGFFRFFPPHYLSERFRHAWSFFELKRYLGS